MDASRLEHPRPRIAVFRALPMGDMLCAVPALRALRAANATAHVTLIALSSARFIVERFPSLVDDLMPFPGAVGFSEHVETDEAHAAFFEQARARRFDLAIQMHGSGGVANDVLLRFGASTHAGFVQSGETRAGTFIEWPDNLREPLRLLALMRALGLHADDDTLSFPLTAADRAGASRLLHDHGLVAQRTVVIHPGAQWASLRWPPERFAAVANVLARQGYAIALTGTAAEKRIVQAVADVMSTRPIDLCGRTSLGWLAALIARVPLVMCNDTGVSHIAAAMRTPSVVIASGRESARWMPANYVRHRVLADHPPAKPSARHGGHGQRCALSVSVADAVDAVRAQLELATALGRCELLDPVDAAAPCEIDVAVAAPTNPASPASRPARPRPIIAAPSAASPAFRSVAHA